MIGKVLTLLAVPLGFVAYASLAKASPKPGAAGPSFNVTGKSGKAWTVVRVSQFQEPAGLLQINDVFDGSNRIVRYSQLGSQIGSRKFITTPLKSGDPRLLAAARDFGITLPKA